MTIAYNPNTFHLAAIVIDANAARILIKSATRRSNGSYELTLQQTLRFPLHLGLDIFEHGKIGHSRQEQLLRMVKVFRQMMIIYNIAEYRACITSAISQASNLAKVLHYIYIRTGVKIEPIGSQEENRNKIIDEEDGTAPVCMLANGLLHGLLNQIMADAPAINHTNNQ